MYLLYLQISKKRYSILQDRKTYWYTVNEIKNEATCPSCGRSIDKFKNLTAHVKRCFSIKKIGPIYRLHGYVECKCGLLIADNTKAQKLHVCMVSGIYNYIKHYTFICFARVRSLPLSQIYPMSASNRNLIRIRITIGIMIRNKRQTIAAITWSVNCSSQSLGYATLFRLSN